MDPPAGGRKPVETSSWQARVKWRRPQQRCEDRGGAEREVVCKNFDCFFADSLTSSWCSPFSPSFHANFLTIVDTYSRARRFLPRRQKPCLKNGARTSRANCRCERTCSVDVHMHLHLQALSARSKRFVRERNTTFVENCRVCINEQKLITYACVSLARQVWKITFYLRS